MLPETIFLTSDEKIMTLEFAIITMDLIKTIQTLKKTCIELVKWNVEILYVIYICEIKKMNLLSELYFIIKVLFSSFI